MKKFMSRVALGKIVNITGGLLHVFSHILGLLKMVIVRIFRVYS
jgi:hypothetical protein